MPRADGYVSDPHRLAGKFIYLIVLNKYFIKY